MGRRGQSARSGQRHGARSARWLAVTLVLGSSEAFGVEKPEPLGLAQVVAAGRARAPAVHAAKAVAAGASAATDSAAAPYYPSLGASAVGTGFGVSGEYTQNGVILLSEDVLSISGGLVAQWTAYDFGRTAHAVSSARNTASEAASEVRATEEDAMALAATAYVDVRAADELLIVTREMTEDRERTAALTDRLAAAGIVAAVDCARAHAATDRARLDEATARGARADAVAALRRILGAEADEPIAVADETVVLPQWVTTMPKDVSIRTDPRVARSRAALDAAGETVEGARAARLPSVFAQGQANLAYSVAHIGGSPPSFVTGRAAVGTASIGVTVPIFDATIGARVEVADQKVAEARAELDRTTLDVRRDIERARADVTATGDAFSLARTVADETTAVLVSAEDRMSSGQISPLALAEAQRDDREAQLVRIRSRYAYERAKIALLRALSKCDILLDEGAQEQ